MLRSRGVIVSSVVLTLSAAVATPLATTPVLPVPGFMTAFGAAMIVINILLAVILFSRGAIEKRNDATALGTAYLFVATIFLPLIASFPGGLVQGSLLGTQATPFWLWVFWHGGFAVAILRYTAVSRQPTEQGHAALRALLAVVVVVAALTLATTTFADYLPVPDLDNHTPFPSTSGVATALLLGLTAAATLRVMRRRNRGPEQTALTVAMVAALIDVWLTYQGTGRFSLGWYLAKFASVFTSLAVLVALLHQINSLYKRTARANGVLADLVRHDSLTGLVNRRCLDETMALEWRKSRRQQQPLALLMVDVDHFKSFNDRYGHPAGDACLRQVAGALLAAARRPGDIAARYGGEEFVLLLPNTDAFGAVELAMRLRTAIRELAVPHNGSPHGYVSVSVGVASVAAGGEGGPDILFAAADRALYRAKAAGRDAICSADDVSVAGDMATAEAVADIPGRLRLPRAAGTVPAALYALQCEILEGIVAGQPLDRVTATLCGKVEQMVPGVVCSIMRVDGANRLCRLADGGLPMALALSLDGTEGRAETGPSGAAVRSGAPVEVYDIAADGRWPATAGALPLAAELYACWINPIKGRDGRVMGLFSLYYRSRRAPTALERNLVDASLHLLALAIERDDVWSQLTSANERFDAAIDNLTQGLGFFSGNRLMVTNRRYCEIYQLDPAQLTPGMTVEAIVDLRIAAGTGPAMARGEYLAWCASRNTADMPTNTMEELANGRLIAVNHQPMPNGQWVTTHEDITEQRRAEQQIVHIARHDALTGLPNRMLFDERLTQAVALSGRGQRCAVLCLDVDNFKTINDTFGHGIGDGLLRDVSERLAACARDVDTVARLGSDEFAILMMGLDRPESAAELAKRIIRTMRKPFELNGTAVVASVSIGIGVAPEDGTISGKLLQCADTALYRAKMEHRGGYRFFEAEMDARLQNRFELERDLRKALHNREFSLAYQPLFDLELGEITGFEALVRWRHPTRGMVSPVDFIPLAEETGLIVALGAWVLQQACLEAASWPKPVKVAVNLSGIQLKASGLVNAVKSALAQSGLMARRLELEITESVLLTNNVETLSTLHALRDLGISIAMDDFGTGYSSLSYLRSFPFDKIKIDQSFIRDITDAYDSTAIIRAVVGLGRSMGMVTTAEGVETEAQLAQLRHEGCNEVQGYLLGRPVAPAEARRLLEDDSLVHERIGGPGVPALAGI